ncbi:MAG: ZIP family metal transporter, partial [Methanomicrobiales archaeon]|nr:ZIP family metal transporter [Methanomicrobiales archaeon]
MLSFFFSLDPVAQALLAGCFTWSVTALGASAVFLTRSVNQRLLDGMMGFAAGVMISASFWSLLIPSIAMAEETGAVPWIPAAAGFAAGWLFILVLDRLVPHLHIGFPEEKAEGPKTSLRRTTLLVMAITLHNIPEGLAIGVAFGAIG